MIPANKPVASSPTRVSTNQRPDSSLQSLRGRLLLLIVIGIGIFYALFAFRTFVLHYYPSPPLIFDEGDSLADWTNTCAWSDRSDRYTVWQSLYTPFSHFLCTIANLIFGQIPPGYFSGWRQFSTNIKFIVAMHIGMWLTILIPIKPFPKSNTLLTNLKYYGVRVLPFRLMTLFSYAALFSFERGNTIGVGYIFFWLSIRAAYFPSLRSVLHPVFVGAAAAIKPYILLFSLYGRRLSGLIIAFLTVVVLQIIPILLVGAPGIENLPDNLKFYSNEFSILNVVSKAIYTFSFNGYRDMKRLVGFGIGSDMLGMNYTLYLDLFYAVSLGLFLLMMVLAFRCLVTSINIDRRESRLCAESCTDVASSSFSRLCEAFNSRLVMLRYAIPAFINVMVFLIYSQSSGAYVILFLLVAVFCIEEETLIISQSPILLSLYFCAICAFDLPGVTSKAYECGIRSISLEYFRQIPLLSELTGQQFLCLGTYTGAVALLRPIFFLLFGSLLMLKLRKRIQLSHAEFQTLSSNAGQSASAGGAIQAAPAALR
jgi:predicted nucleic acid-binding Zn ribbon protein